MDSQWLQAVAKAVNMELSAAEADTVLPKVQRAFARRPKHEDWTAEVRRARGSIAHWHMCMSGTSPEFGASRRPGLWQ
jgi:hypothetical protein